MALQSSMSSAHMLLSHLPFTNDRCSVIGFTYVVGARTHTRKDSQSSPSCWWNGYKQRTQVPRCLGGIFRSHRAAAGCMPVP